MHFINKNMFFNGYLSYFLGPLFNGEEGPNPRVFKDLKEFKISQIKEADWSLMLHI